MVKMPQRACFRKLPLLILDKNYDGSYYVHGDLTVKYPEFGEILPDVVNMRSADRESLVLVVDVEELLDSRRDVEHTMCGFLVRENSVELFDAYEAIGMFGAGVREAFASGRCTVSSNYD